MLLTAVLFFLHLHPCFFTLCLSAYQNLKRMLMITIASPQYHPNLLVSMTLTMPQVSYSVTSLWTCAQIYTCRSIETGIPLISLKSSLHRKSSCYWQQLPLQLFILWKPEGMSQMLLNLFFHVMRWLTYHFADCNCSYYTSCLGIAVCVFLWSTYLMLAFIYICWNLVVVSSFQTYSISPYCLSLFFDQPLKVETDTGNYNYTK